MTSYATRTQSSSEQNDLKKLKSKYSSKLNTLKELFADWSDEDLLFALDEADGVLEVAVDRISEGHATQWGEVKTKKAKKEAQQKAKAAAVGTTSSAQTMSYQKPERTYTERPKPTKGRVPSTYTNNNYSKKSTTSTTTSWGYNSGQKSSSSLDNTGDSWASIASTKPVRDSSPEWNTMTTTDTTTTTAITNDSWVIDDKEITDTANSSALLDDSDKPKSWASLLKSQPKPEPPIQNEESEWTFNEERNTTTITTNEVEDAWIAKDDGSVKDEWNAPVETSDAWGSSTVVIEEVKVVSESGQDIESIEPPANESPAVLPNNEIDVKFGSLNLADEAPQEPAHVEERLTDTKVETPAQPEATAESTLEDTVPIKNFQQSTTTEQQQQPAYSQPQIKEQQQPTQTQEHPTQTQEHPTQTQQQPTQTQQQPTQVQTTYTQAQPIQPQLQQQTAQQHPQQFPHQPLGMDHLTSAYSSYLPNQHHTGMSGFGMSPMGNLPDYGAYGTEAQRAAAMGYYDPSAFNNSPGAVNTSSYPSRDKFGQDTSAALGTAQGQPAQSQGLHGQQMYPGMPYYPYYYMPSHYSTYQQSIYGQPMMGKSMYPNMYQQQAQQQLPQHQHQQQQLQQQQQQPTSTNKPSTQSPYGVNGAGATTSSPYDLHSQLYNQSTGGASGVSGYDDLQQQFGLHDYQKSPYGNSGGQQLQGFLGHHLQGQQQPSTSTSQQGQVLDSSIKNDSGHGNLSSSQPQQQPQQHQMNNYFNQQQMFSYQQYPQQQYWNQ